MFEFVVSLISAFFFKLFKNCPSAKEQKKKKAVESLQVMTQGRRRLLNEKLKNKEYDDVECLRAYVEIPDGRLIFTTCWAPKSQGGHKKKKKKILSEIPSLNNYKKKKKIKDCNKGIDIKMGYVVFSWDNLGQGRSDGLWNYVDNWPAFLNNAAFAIRTLALGTYCKRYNIKSPSQCILAGQSMGGAYTVELSKKMKDEFAGMVLIAPMCRIDDNNCITPCCPAANLTPTADINAWLTSDSEVRQQVDAHPLLYDRNPRLQTGMQLFGATITIGEELDKVSLPFLILHGTGDK
ncbi:hypothetical protein RFI_09719, partial [Reticulomyxa filosa]